MSIGDGAATGGKGESGGSSRAHQGASCGGCGGRRRERSPAGGARSESALSESRLAVGLPRDASLAELRDGSVRPPAS
jgi:hypothetical protein